MNDSYILDPGPCLCGHVRGTPGNGHVLAHHSPMAFGRKCERVGCTCPKFLPYLAGGRNWTARIKFDWPLEPLTPTVVW